MRRVAFVLGAALMASIASAQAPPPLEPPVIQSPAPREPQAPSAAQAPNAASKAGPPQRRQPKQRQPAPPTTDLPAFVTETEIPVNSDFRGTRVNIIALTSERRGRGDFVVALRGPNQPAVVRRKTRFLVFWVNGQPVRFDEAPSFLAVVSEKPLRDIASPRAIWTLRLDPAASARLAGPTPAGADPASYRQALVRLRRQAGLYIEDPHGLRRPTRGALSAQIRLPANAPLGKYVSDVYFFRDGRLLSMTSSEVTVSREGWERTVYDVATRYGFLYGLCVVLVALGAGWAAGVMLRRA